MNESVKNFVFEVVSEARKELNIDDDAGIQVIKEELESFFNKSNLIRDFQFLSNEQLNEIREKLKQQVKEMLSYEP